MKKAILINLLLLFSVYILHAVEKNEIIKDQHFCNLRLLPEEILNHIASYIHFANNVYETEVLFLDRMRKSGGMLEKTPIDSNKLIAINDTKLELSDSVDKHNLLQELTLQEKSRGINYKPRFFALSVDNNYLAVLTTKSGQEIQQINKIEIFRRNEPHTKFLKMQEIDVEKPINGITISRKGQVAIVDWDKVFLMQSNERKSLYTAPKKYMGPFSNGKHQLWGHRIVDVLFNKQETYLAFKFHYLYECFYETDNAFGTELYNQALFKKLLQEWFSKKSEQYSEISPLFDESIDSPPTFLEKIRTKLQKCEDTVAYELLFRNGIHESSSIKVIPLQPEKPWTLEKYFMLKGVCKNLNQQCGFQK